MRFLALSLIFFCSVVLAEKAEVSKKSDVQQKNDASQGAFDVSKGFSSVVDKLLPAVVSVQATQVVAQRGPEGGLNLPGLPPGNFGPGNPIEELFREFMGQGHSERPRKMQAVGAGFIIHCDEKIAYVVTNHHVVSEAKTLTIVLEDKTEIPGTLLASDERNDVAVVKLDLSNLPKEKRNLPTVAWANSEDVKTGDWVIAIGNPFNFGGTVTVGVVSHKGRYVPSGMQQDFEFIQHSAQINVGSSGGALFDVYGKVIGINNAIITNTGGNIGIGFAIPANVARQTVDQLVAFGKTRRGQLGIRIQELNEDMAESQGLKDTGVIVGSVIEGGPSEGKLEVGDIILEYEGKKVTKSYILSSMVGATEIGKSITLKVWRKGKIMEIKIKVEEMPDNKKEIQAGAGKIASENVSSSVNIAGIEISKIPEELKARLKEANKESKGVIIVKIDPNSNAADQGLLMKGDIIEEANHKSLDSPSDFEQIVKQAKKERRKNILLFISRDGKPAYLPLRIDDEGTNPSENNKKDSNKHDSEDESEKVDENKTKKSDEKEKEKKQQSLDKSDVAEDEPAQKPKSSKVENVTEESKQPLKSFSEHEQKYAEADANVHEIQDADAMNPQLKDEQKSDALAKDNKNALDKKDNDSWTSLIVSKLRSIFGNN